MTDVIACACSFADCIFRKNIIFKTTCLFTMIQPYTFTNTISLTTYHMMCAKAHSSRFLALKKKIRKSIIDSESKSIKTLHQVRVKTHCTWKASRQLKTGAHNYTQQSRPLNVITKNIITKSNKDTCHGATSGSRRKIKSRLNLNTTLINIFFLRSQTHFA